MVLVSEAGQGRKARPVGRLSSRPLDFVAQQALRFSRAAPRGVDPRRHPPAGGDEGVVRDLAADLRRSRRSDRRHAAHAGRREALDRPATVPLRAVLLHAPPRARGPAARDLRRMAAQRRPRCARRRHPLHPARRRRAPRAVRHLRRLRRHHPRRVALPGPRSRGHRDRRAGRRPRRPQGTGPPGPRGSRGGLVRRPHLLRRAVPGRRARRRRGRLGARPPAADADRAGQGGRGRRPAATDQRRRAAHRAAVGSTGRADPR